MKEQLTRFGCDKCNKKIDCGSFPYSDGWVYVYNLNLQKINKEMPIVDRVEKKDLHFCCKKCLLKHFEELI